MTQENEMPHAANQEREKKLKQLEHDIKNYLTVVSMGLHALEGVKEEPEAFAELAKMIEEEGVHPLKQTVSQMITLALTDSEKIQRTSNT